MRAAVKPDPVWMDFMPDEMGPRFAVAFDPHGRLGWKSNRIVDPDGDPINHHYLVLGEKAGQAFLDGLTLK